jgi:hypothetical protein
VAGCLSAAVSLLEGVTGLPAVPSVLLLPSVTEVPALRSDLVAPGVSVAVLSEGLAATRLFPSGVATVLPALLGASAFCLETGAVSFGVLIPVILPLGTSVFTLSAVAC